MAINGVFVLKPMPSKYQQFPFAISAPTRDREAMTGWLRDKAWFYNRDYLCYDVAPSSNKWSTQADILVYAFRTKANMLLFKLMWAG